MLKSLGGAAGCGSAAPCSSRLPPRATVSPNPPPPPYPLQESRPRPTSTAPSRETAASTPSASARTPRRSLGKESLISLLAFVEHKGRLCLPTASVLLSTLPLGVASVRPRCAKGAARTRRGGAEETERRLREFRSAAARVRKPGKKGSPFIFFPSLAPLENPLENFPVSPKKTGTARPSSSTAAGPCSASPACWARR